MLEGRISGLDQETSRAGLQALFDNRVPVLALPRRVRNARALLAGSTDEVDDDSEGQGEGVGGQGGEGGEGGEDDGEESVGDDQPSQDDSQDGVDSDDDSILSDVLLPEDSTSGTEQGVEFTAAEVPVPGTEPASTGDVEMGEGEDMTMEGQGSGWLGKAKAVGEHWELN